MQKILNRSNALKWESTQGPALRCNCDPVD